MGTDVRFIVTNLMVRSGLRRCPPHDHDGVNDQRRKQRGSELWHGKVLWQAGGTQTHQRDLTLIPFS
jgi:hypothetical protein